jgi:ABC-2 type transport system permease protein
LKDGDYNALLYIPSKALEQPDKITLYSEKQASLTIVDYVEQVLQKEIENSKLADKGIDRALLNSIKTDVSIHSVKLTDNGEESSNAGLTTSIGMFAGVLIYVFIFMFGTQVMRGVIEEKTNRIVEVMISSVKPFQLMMGKIIGIAMVGLTQFLLWIVLSAVLTSAVGTVFLKDKQMPKTTQQMMLDKVKMANNNSLSSDVSAADQSVNKNPTDDIFASFGSLNVPLLAMCFIFYFLGGYLLYGALFAAIGSAVDSEADTQQFMLPVTIPLILSFVMAQYVITSPDGPIAFWFSMIPFTSPVIMMVRLPFGVPGYQIALSMVLLVLGFMGTTWVAARIYRTGILMYGKKPSYREIGKWLFYKG